MTVIDHGAELTSAYAHQSRFVRGPGRIRQGDSAATSATPVPGAYLRAGLRVTGRRWAA